MNLQVKKIKDVKSPERAHPTDSGIDFFVPDGVDLDLRPRESITFPLGVSVRIPKWYDLVFHNRSSIASQNGVILWACVVDNGYEWEILLNLINTSGKSFKIKWWNKIVQAVMREVGLWDVEVVKEFKEEKKEKNTKKTRGEGGFGSTGN